MIKNFNLRTRKAQASFEIVLMMTVIFAFCFIISESEKVSGQAIYNPGAQYTDQGTGIVYTRNSAGQWTSDDPNAGANSWTDTTISSFIRERFGTLTYAGTPAPNPPAPTPPATPTLPAPTPPPAPTTPPAAPPTGGPLGKNPASAANTPTGTQSGLFGGMRQQDLPADTGYWNMNVPNNPNLRVQAVPQEDGSAKINLVDAAGKVYSTLGTMNNYANMAADAREKGIMGMLKDKYSGIAKLIGMDPTKPAPENLLGSKITDPGQIAAINKAVEATAALDKTYMPITRWLTDQIYPGATSMPSFGWWGPLVEGAIWGAVAAGIGYGIGALLKWSDNNKMALSVAMGVGVFTGEALSNLLIAKAEMSTLWGSIVGWGVGGLVGVGIFLLMFKRQDTKIATFTCMQWQPPKGTKDCEKCNEDELRPCSEYRCKSLGANCAIVQGAGRDLCVSKDLSDVSPPVISPNENALSKGYKYTDVKSSPPGPGFRIIGETQRCVKPFTAIKFGISLNEPAQCKIDYNDTGDFESMRYYFGESNSYEYNHTQQMVLPSVQAMKNSSFILYNEGEWTFYVRCSDAMGNFNSAAHAIRLCVDPSEDTTPPEILMTSLNNAGCVAANQNNAVVEFYTNEPADCRWAHEDRTYDEMPYQMTCDSQIYQMNALEMYTCRATLTEIARDSTKFYVRCRDQPEKEKDRNTNQKSFVFELRTSESMQIKKITPLQDETIYGGTSPLTVQLQAQTEFGCENGKSLCYYSITGNDADYIQFFETDSDIHTQSLDLGEGKHTFYVKCVDSGGNLAVNSTTFELKLETTAPAVSRVYEQSGMLKIVTLKDSDCSYTFDNCDFTFPEGINMPTDGTKEHSAEWQRGQTYYIKCRDKYKNEPSGCSIIVKPEDILLA